jgi:hypothetical protein
VLRQIVPKDIPARKGIFRRPPGEPPAPPPSSRIPSAPHLRRRFIRDLIREQRLRRIDGDVLLILLPFRNAVRNSCWCPVGYIAEQLGCARRTVQRALARLQKAGLLEQQELATRDPDEHNRTGWRIVFLFLAPESYQPGPGPDRRPPRARKVWHRIQPPRDDNLSSPPLLFSDPAESSEPMVPLSPDPMADVSSKGDSQGTGKETLSSSVFPAPACAPEAPPTTTTFSGHPPGEEQGTAKAIAGAEPAEVLDVHQAAPEPRPEASRPPAARSTAAPIRVATRTQEPRQAVAGPRPAPPAAGVDPEQMGALVAQARALMGDNTPGEPWFHALVVAYTVAWVQAALRRAAEQRARGKPIVAGYVVRTLQGFARDGGPSPELVRPAAREPEPLSGDARAVRSIQNSHPEWTAGQVKAHFLRVVDWSAERFDRAAGDFRVSAGQGPGQGPVPAVGRWQQYPKNPIPPPCRAPVRMIHFS